MTPIIETDRLILREFNINDYKDVYEFGSNLEVQRYTGDKIIESLDSAKELIKNVLYVDYKKYGFEKLGLDKIIGIAVAENIGSCKVLEKIGLFLYKIDEYDGDGKEYNWYKINR